jgi:hypothetical protein
MGVETEWRHVIHDCSVPKIGVRAYAYLDVHDMIYCHLQAELSASGAQYQSWHAMSGCCHALPMVLHPSSCRAHINVGTCCDRSNVSCSERSRMARTAHALNWTRPSCEFL